MYLLNLQCLIIIIIIFIIVIIITIIVCRDVPYKCLNVMLLVSL